jgi:tetratricopeptide (TPR) repeat protein
MALAGVVVVLAAATMLQQRYWQTTLDTFEHALIVDERNYLAHGIVGTVYQAGGDDAKALQHFNRAIELRPNHFESVHNSAMSLLRLGRTDEAIARLRDALRIVPDSASAQFLLGNALTEKKDYSAATAAYAEAVLLDPEMADAHAALGASFARQGRRDEALRELQAALKLQPNHPGALRSLREFGFVTER